MRKKETLGMKKGFSSERYEVEFCPVCNGNERLPEKLDSFKPCTRCGGFGFIVKNKRTYKRYDRNLRPGNSSSKRMKTGKWERILSG